MASFAIILVVCGALWSIGGIESSPFPPPTPTRRYGPPDFVNMKPRLHDWDPVTPPKRPGLGIAEEPMVPVSNMIPIPDSNASIAKELAFLDSNPIPVPGTPEEPIPVPGTPEEPIPVPGTPEEPIPVPGTPEEPIPVPGTLEEPIPVPDTPEEPIPVPGTAEEPPGSDPIPVPDTTVGEEPAFLDSDVYTPLKKPGLQDLQTTIAEEHAFPNSDVYIPPPKPGLQDLHLIPVPITGGGPSAYP